jgi:ATP-dependent protease ClpP protease subunit
VRKIISQIRNGPAPGSSARKWFSVRNGVAPGEHEILIRGQIGVNWWTGDGVSETEFEEQLDQIPRDEKVTFGIDSEGGSVQTGLVIFNAISRRRNTYARIDGYAVSIASAIPLSCEHVISPSSSIWMLHEPWSVTQGDSEEHLRASEMLNQHAEMLVDIYAQKTGKTRDEIRAAMRKETWLRGSEAVSWGLADESPDKVLNLRRISVSGFKNVPDYVKNFAARAGAQPQPKPAAPCGSQENHMTREEIIAALRARGEDVDENASIELLKAQLMAPPKAKAKLEKKPETETGSQDEEVKAVIVDLRAELKRAQDAREKAEQANAAANKTRIRAEIQKFADDGRIDGNSVDGWTETASADAKSEVRVLKQLGDLPVKRIGAEPSANIEVGASSKEIVVAFHRHDEPIRAWRGGRSVEMKDIGKATMARAKFFNKHRAALIDMVDNYSELSRVFNTNTIATELKRNVIMQDVIRDFARKLIPFNAFSTKYESVPLEGTNKVEIAFYDLDTVASVSWNASNGYNTAADTTTDKREITVGTGATDGDRLRVDLGYTSEEIARQPYLNIRQLFQLKVEKLASDIVTDVLGIITLANYGAAAITRAPAAFNTDDVADLKLACKLWPDVGRSLIIDSEYDTALLKDDSVKHSLNLGSDAAIREGRVGPRLMGFDYMEFPTIPANGENLKGFAVFKSAILVATAPVPPLEEVRAAGTMYDVFVDPQTGIGLESRRFGSNVLDSATNVAECSYGFAKGNGNALKRICAP